MYKTVRHGENSLQYTILPQTDDFRTNPIDAEHHGRSGTRSRNNIGKRKHKSSLLAYVGLFFICSVVTGAILIPLLVTTDLMPSPATWFIKSQKAREIENKSVNIKYIEDEKPQAGLISATFKPYTGKSRNTIIAPVLRENIKKSDTLSTIPLNTKGGLESTRLRTTSTMSVGLNSNNDDENGLSENEISNDIDKTIIKIETTSKLPITLKAIQPTITSAEVITIPEILTEPTTTTTTATTTTQTTTTALPSTTIKDNDYIIITSTLSSTQPPPPPPPPPSISRDNSNSNTNPRHNPSKPKILYQEITSRHNNSGTASAQNQTNNNNDYVAKIHLLPAETNQNSDSKTWIKSHWPFVDPSTYFQWAGYDSEDSIILPAILCTALILIFLVFTLCILARNRKLFVNSIWIRKRTRDQFSRDVANDVQGADDNTTLLVNDNASEEE